MRDAEYEYITTWEEVNDEGIITLSRDVKIVYRYEPETLGYFDHVSGTGCGPTGDELECIRVYQELGTRWVAARPQTVEWAASFVEAHHDELVENAIQQNREARLG